MFYERIKRLLDIVLCVFALIVLSPVFLIAMIGIMLFDPGPVFFSSTRAGKNKRPFHFYKFRSMRQPHEKDRGLCIADPDRVFPFGKLIRRLKIDELPQLINVVKGDMSIVGPRPMDIHDVNKVYSGKYEQISSITPGLTSAASLFDYTVGDSYTDDCAYREEVLPVKLELELYYLKHRSLFYDFNLVIRTMWLIILVFLGRKKFQDQPELVKIHNITKEKR